MFGVIALVAAGILLGDLLRRARIRGAMEDAWRREDLEFLQKLRGSR